MVALGGGGGAVGFEASSAGAATAFAGVAGFGDTFSTGLEAGGDGCFAEGLEGDLVLTGAFAGTFAGTFAGALGGAFAINWTAFAATFLAGLAGLAAGLAAGLKAAFFTVGFAATFGLAFATTLEAGFEIGFAFDAGLAFTTGFATGLALAFGEALFATGLLVGFAFTAVLLPALLAGLDFFAGVFISCLLAAAACGWEAGCLPLELFRFIPRIWASTDGCSARDCSDLPAPKPIILKNTSITRSSDTTLRQKITKTAHI